MISEGELHIDGRIEGDIRCRVLIVGVNAQISGAIQADVAKVHGSINGHLCARSVFLASPAKVTGDITHERLEIEPGAFLEGHCRHMNDPIPAEQGPADLMLTDARDSKNNAESDFHRRRKAFVIFDCGILTARVGFDGSHFDLLTQAGFDESRARGIIEQNARGYALDGSVYFYQGTDFSCLSEQNKKTAASFLPWFEKTAGWIKRERFTTVCMPAGSALVGRR